MVVSPAAPAVCICKGGSIKNRPYSGFSSKKNNSNSNA